MARGDAEPAGGVGGGGQLAVVLLDDLHAVAGLQGGEANVVGLGYPIGDEAFPEGVL